MVRRALLVLLLIMPVAGGYSVLSHEAIVDSAWEQFIKPLLVRYFPDATEEDLLNAHAYAYGGAIIQDLGYYPFGSHLFTDLAHYVRSGDLVHNLLLEAQDINEYAFALGSMAHYASDNYGHPIGVNPSVPLVYPNARKFGKSVPYEEDKTDHLKMEFAFDVLQVAQGHYAPQAYHDFIGFKVAKPVLERAVRKTYGVELKDMFLSIDLALGTYRRTIGRIIPEMTKVAWNSKKAQLTKEVPGLTRRRFVYNLSRASYEKEWGHEYEKPGFGARLLSCIFRTIPKVGPFRALSFKPPTEAADQLFMKSFNTTLTNYKQFLVELRSGKQVSLPNTNFDTGKPTKIGQYQLADETYARLLEKLKGSKFSTVDEPLRENILSFYDHAKTDPKVAANLAQIRSLN